MRKATVQCRKEGLWDRRRKALVTHNQRCRNVWISGALSTHSQGGAEKQVGDIPAICSYLVRLIANLLVRSSVLEDDDNVFA